MGEYVTSIPRLSWIPLNNPLVRADPRSDVHKLGNPNNAVQWSMKASAIASDVGSTKGTAWRKRVLLSLMVKIYLKPFDGGRGPTMSR